MTSSPVHLATLQRGVAHLTACGTVSRLVTYSPGDATCPECRRVVSSAPIERPGHIPGCTGSGIVATGRRGEVRYCACAHPRALTREEVARRIVVWIEEDAARYDGQ